MKRLTILLAATLATAVHAQTARKCATDELYREGVRRKPEIADYQKALDEEVYNYLHTRHINNAAAKGTGYANDTAALIIPVVVHIIHNYDAEYIADSQVYRFIAVLNTYYSKQNADTASVIIPFKPYIGNAHIRFALATKDPQGLPTNGITRKYSYQTYGGDEAAKFDQWNSYSYLNIWLEATLGNSNAGTPDVLGYATMPAYAVANPYSDGVVMRTDDIAPLSVSLGIEHCIGHYLNLIHTWGNGGIETACGDDGVDDTPPTIGHYSTCHLFDTLCAHNYYKLYDSLSYFNLYGSHISTANIIVDYPDTVNTQNIMDYSSCSNMFTKGQVVVMRSALKSTTAGRNNLSTVANLALTGAISPKPDLAPIADFNVTQQIACIGQSSANLQFVNRSWNDTISTVAWTFSNGAGNPTSTSFTAVTGQTFSQPGWVTVKIKAVSNSGSDSITKSNAIYVADSNSLSPAGYVQDFNDSNDYHRWPIFNYYSMPYKWDVINTAGLYDHTCIRYSNFDLRSNPPGDTQLTQNPRGNYADFFSEPFDLTLLASNPNARLSFYSAGAFRTSIVTEMNDSLLVSYSTTCGATWHTLGNLNKAALGNNGFSSTPFAPISPGDWTVHGFLLPPVVKTGRTMFRFRYKNGGSTAWDGYSYNYNSGNNFYLDRIEVTSNTLEVDAVALNEKGIVLAPNPTSGGTTLTIKGGGNSMATIRVTDITGKAVYHTETVMNGNITQIEIPAERISIKGIYLLEVVTVGRVMTQKLVVY